MTRYDRLLLATARICLALVCLMPLVVSYSTIYPFVVGKALFARSLVEVALGAWLLLAWRVPGYRPRPSVILLALLAWLAVSALASFAGVNPTRSLWSDYARMHGVVELAHWFGFILVAAAVFRTIPSWRRLLAVNLAVGAVVSALGLAQYLGLVDWIFIFSTAQRAGSTLGSGLYLGAYAAMNAGLGAALLFLPWRGGRYWRGYWIRCLLAGVVALDLAGLWFSATRSGFLGVVVMALVFAGGALLLERRRIVVRGALGLLAALVLVASVGLLSGAMGVTADYDVMLRRLSSAASGDDNSIRHRLGTLRVGLEGYRERPALGWGPENYRSAWGRHITSEEYSGRIVDQAHNKAVDTLVATGTVGFFIYVLLWLALALTAARLALDREGPDRRFALAMAAALAGYLAISLFLFDTQSFMLQFALLAAFFASQEFDRAGLLAAWPAVVQRFARRLDGLARRRLALPAVSLVVAALVVFSLAQWSVRPFLAAQNMKLEETWALTLMEARRSYQIFPPLAAHRRYAMMINTINAMDSLPEHEVDFAMEYIGDEIRLALAEEPDNWYAHYLAAEFYRAAARRDERHTPLAEHHAGELERIGPDSPYLERTAAAEGISGSASSPTGVDRKGQ